MGGSMDLGSSTGGGHAPPRIQTAPFSITVIDRPSHSAAPMRRTNSSASGVGFKRCVCACVGWFWLVPGAQSGFFFLEICIDLCNCISAMNGPQTLSPTGLGSFGFVGSNGTSNRNSGSGSGLEVVGSNGGLSAAPTARERAWSARTTKDLRPPSRFGAFSWVLFLYCVLSLWPIFESNSRVRVCRQRPPPEALHLELPKAFVATPAAGSGASVPPQQAMQQQQQLALQQQPQHQQQSMFASHGQAPSNLFAIPEFAAERAVGGSSSHFAHLEAASSASSTHSIDRLPSASKSRSGARMRMPSAGDGPT